VCRVDVALVIDVDAIDGLRQLREHLGLPAEPSALMGTLMRRAVSVTPT